MSRPGWHDLVMALVLNDPDVGPHVGPEHATDVQVYKEGFASLPSVHVLTRADGLTRHPSEATLKGVAILMALRGHVLKEESVVLPQSATLRAIALENRGLPRAIEALKRRLAPKSLTDRIIAQAKSPASQRGA